MLKKYKITLFLLILVINCFAQEPQHNKEKKYESKTFKSIQLINSQTTETGPKHSFNFILQHRFGSTDINHDFIKNFLGMDLVSNIRFGFAVPIKQRVLLSVGRTRYKKHYDFGAKYTFLKQTVDKKIPFSAALNLNMAVMSGKFPQVPPDHFFSDGMEPFEYQNIHRLSYISQLILAHKFSNSLSLQIAPIYVHRNLAKEYEGSDLIAIPLGGQIKTGMFSSIVFEYAYIIDKPEHLLNPYSLGWQNETASHVFQLYLSTSNRILDFSHYSNESPEDVLKGKFYFGFNLNKKLWIKK